HAGPACAHVDLVQVQLEDLGLGEMAVELTGKSNLAELAAELLGAGQLLWEHVAHELHGDRAEPLAQRERRRVAPERARHAVEVDAGVFPEAPVLDGYEAVPDDGGHRVEVDDDAALRGEVRQEGAVRGEYAGGL